jgi:hypothetical protein
MSDELEPLVNLNALKKLVKAAVRELIDEGQLAANLDETARQIAEINCKPFITVPEAQLLLGCSDSHLYKQIKLAREKKTANPIPYMDIEGVYSLPREALLKWATPKRLKVA